MNARNPKYSRPDNSAIDLEYQHPVYGWIPFTATETDPEKLGRDLFAAAKAGQFSAVAAYVAPPPPPPVIPKAVTMRQARLALLQAGLLDDVAQAIAAIQDPTQRQAASIEWEYSTEVVRDRQWVVTLAAALGLSSEQLDQLFVLAATL